MNQKDFNRILTIVMESIRFLWNRYDLVGIDWILWNPQDFNGIVLIASESARLLLIYLRKTNSSLLLNVRLSQG